MEGGKVRRPLSFHAFQIEDGDEEGSGEGGASFATPSWRQRGRDHHPSSLSPTPTLSGGRGGSSSSQGPAIVTDRLKNSPPMLQRKLQKLPVFVGKSFRSRVPEDTFSDEEDGGTRNLRLSLRWSNDSVVVNRHSWVKFDERSQELSLL